MCRANVDVYTLETNIDTKLRIVEQQVSTVCLNYAQGKSDVVCVCSNVFINRIMNYVLFNKNSLAFVMKYSTYKYNINIKHCIMYFETFIICLTLCPKVRT